MTHTEPQISVLRNTVDSSVHSKCVYVSTARAAGLLVGVVKYLLFGLFVLGLNRLRRYLKSRGRGQRIRLLSEVYILVRSRGRGQRVRLLSEAYTRQL